MYEWTWIEREKDHRGIDIRVMGLLPITPFSTLAVLPLTRLAPLAAKHVWLLLTLAFLVPLAWMLRSLTKLDYCGIAIVCLLSFPMHRNLLYGQFYILLLLLIVAACWSYLRGLRGVAGALLAIAAACKVFPALLFVFFLQRREWRALLSGMSTGLAAIAISISVFGWNAHRTWLIQIFPWVTRGEAMPPYTVSSASFSSLLHRLFLYEPQWNPHPWHLSPLWFAVLLPLLQWMTLAPAILLIQRHDRSRNRVLLEWAALLTASLAISTIPASYNFVLMIFPACIAGSVLVERKEYTWLTLVAVAYLGIGFPVPDPHGSIGLGFLLYMPRLPLLLVMLVAIYRLLWLGSSATRVAPDWLRYIWVGAMAASLLWNIPATFRMERAQQEELGYRVPLQQPGFLNANPQVAETGIRYTAFTFHGYQLVTQTHRSMTIDPAEGVTYDDLSFASQADTILVERAGAGVSQIVDLKDPLQPVVANGHDPMLSATGLDMAYISDDHGRGQLRVRRKFQAADAEDVVLAPRAMNVYEGSFRSEHEYAFSATRKDGAPQIFLTDALRTNAPLSLGISRYPALSPDARWMAYSRLDHGVWNLWLRNQQSGQTHRVADVPCNQIQPSWEGDSKTLLYGTDCGRSLWFTAVARRKVVP